MLFCCYAKSHHIQQLLLHHNSEIKMLIETLNSAYGVPVMRVQFWRIGLHGSRRFLIVLNKSQLPPVKKMLQQHST